MGSRLEFDGVCPLQRRLVGHGIGPLFRTGLQVLHHYDPSRTRLMRPGMVFTMEPMINAGTHAPTSDRTAGRRSAWTLRAQRSSSTRCSARKLGWRS
jgi:methionine aminopeptidase